MRRPLIAGNWKMNLHRQEAVALADQMKQGLGSIGDVELVVCPPSTYLDAVGTAIQGTPISLGAQNVFPEGNGAFTGEISLSMLKDLGCRYVILGHSERRQILQESNAVINRKLLATLQSGITPIVCVGETLAERESGKTRDIVQEQLSGSLAGLTSEQAASLVIAYEPVWAIGTGKVATPQQAQEVHAELRRMLEIRYNRHVADTVRIQYGGSVKPDNARELMAQPDIDGALVGGASLKADSFLGIAVATAAA